MNKAIAILSTGIAVLSSITAYSFYRDVQTHRQQLDDYEKQVAQLLEHLDDNTRQRMEYENQIQQLNSDLLRSNNRIKTLDTTLAATQEMISPDYTEVEQAIRQRVTDEVRRQYEPDDTPSAVTLLNQLSQLSQEERMSILQIQGQYAGFLNSLDTSPERKEAITQALIDVTLGQNQARSDLFAQGLEPRAMRGQMASIMSPESTREALSYELTDAELELFDEHQQQIQTQAFAFNPFRTATGAGGGPGGPPGVGGTRIEQFSSGVIVGPGIGTESEPVFIINEIQALPAPPQ